MAGNKIFVGPRLRQLRRQRGQTQAEMAAALSLSASYVNLLENNQRSVSAQVLLRLAERYGVDWRDLVEDDGVMLLADLRNALQDPVFDDHRPDLHQLRGAADHAPQLARALLRLYKSYHTLSEHLLSLGMRADGDEPGSHELVLARSPETLVHDLFRDNRNYFHDLEVAAEGFRGDDRIDPDESLPYLKKRLRDGHGIDVVRVPVAEMPGTLRVYDEDRRRILLSDGLDYPNKVFQLTHVFGLLECSDIINGILDGSGLQDELGRARGRVELANYFAAAVSMPYSAFLREAKDSRYDIDHLAARFGVSFEQVCHRLSTMQRDGAQGVPFFFLRIDRAGNVTKRFNATSFHLAEYGGPCPLWDIHNCFRVPGSILPQFVEVPEGARYFTISRSVDRPILGPDTRDYRLAVTLGCPIEHASEIVYASHFQLDDEALVTPIGINCRLCPRKNCAQRAQRPVHLDLPIDERRRGQTRFQV